MSSPDQEHIRVAFHLFPDAFADGFEVRHLHRPTVRVVNVVAEFGGRDMGFFPPTRRRRHFLADPGACIRSISSCLAQPFFHQGASRGVGWGPWPPISSRILGHIVGARRARSGRSCGRSCTRSGMARCRLGRARQPGVRLYAPRIHRCRPRFRPECHSPGPGRLRFAQAICFRCGVE